MKRIARFALFGAVGFGIGGLFPQAATLFAFAIGWEQTNWQAWQAWVIVCAVLVFGFAAKGALGGTALGLALRRGRRMTAALALWGSIGFLAGGFLFAFLVPGGMFGRVALGIDLLGGALGGAALGLALKDKRKIIGLALAGALGFLIGSMIATYLHYWLGFGFLPTVIIFFLQGIIGGASLGAALGYLEKR